MSKNISEDSNDKVKSLFYYIVKLAHLISKKRKWQAVILLGGMIFQAFFETAALGAISLFVNSLASPESLISSYWFTKVVDVLGINGNLISVSNVVIFFAVLIAFLTIVKNALKGILTYGIARYSSLIQAYVGDTLLARFLIVDYEWHLKENVQNLFVTLNWRRHVSRLLERTLTCINDGLMVIVMITGLVLIQPDVMIILILTIATFSMLIYLLLKKPIDKVSKNVKKLEKSSSLSASKALHGMKDVRIFCLERSFLKDFSQKVYLLSKEIAARSVIGKLPALLLESVGFIMIAILIIFMLSVSKYELDKAFSVISLLAIASWRVMPAMNRILSNISNIRTHLPFFDSILEFLDGIDSYMDSNVAGWRPKIPKDIKRNNTVEDITKLRKTIFNSSIEFRNIDFRYGVNTHRESQQKALDNVSFIIKKGQSIGIIGSSGAGKSTLVDLFIGLIRPSHGDILIDGNRLDEKELRFWRGNIGYVPQSPYIYDCSLAENIAFGENLKHIDGQKILGACHNASIDFLDNLEEGIYTNIGDKGSRLSGGQRQRISIARALYNQPEILVFDEATSALDNKAENEIKQTIDSFKGKQTLMIIAHRLTTVEDCDLIVWMEHGKVREMGTPVDILPKYNAMMG
jgi:ATP-binding cassette, subfamily B, bacterial PglK